MKNERDRQLREAAEQKGNALYQYRLTPNGIADELINFAKSDTAKQYWQEQFKQPVNLEELRKEWNERSDYIKSSKSVATDVIFDFFVSKLSGQHDNDAIEFAEWISKNYIKSNCNIWISFKDINIAVSQRTYYTTQELYELFKTNKTPTK